MPSPTFGRRNTIGGESDAIELQRQFPQGLVLA
jgi:hypothetical protein